MPRLGKRVGAAGFKARRKGDIDLSDPIASDPKLLKVRSNGVEVGEIPDTGDRIKNLEAMRALLKEKGLSRQLEQWEAIRFQAQHFSLSAELLWDHGLNVMPRKGFAGIPFVVVTAFAVELYLKSMISRAGLDVPRIHDLARLYGKLSAADLQLVEEFDRKFTGDAKFENAGVSAMLRVLRADFERWRYAFEHPRLNTLTFDELIHLLKVFENASGETKAR